jgi:hypothetical protein
MKTKLGSISFEGLKRLFSLINEGNLNTVVTSYRAEKSIIKPEEIIELNIEAELPELRFSQNSEEFKKDDEINTIKLHQSLARLSPSEASSKGIWVWFTHVFYWKYMLQRWKVPESSNKQEIQNYISSHYLIKGQNTRSFIRNGVARLWWYGHLSQNDGSYVNTGILLRQLDIASTLLERSQGRNQNIRNVFFKKLYEHKKDFLDSGNEARIRVRELAKRINFFGSTRLIDAFSMHELEIEFEKMIHEVLSEKP